MDKEHIERRSVDNEYVRRLAVLETKLDILIDNSVSDSATRKELAKRVDDLENHRHWITGGVAALFTVSGLLWFGLRGHVRDIAEEEVMNSMQDGDKLITELCTTDRVLKNQYKERPEICRM